MIVQFHSEEAVFDHPLVQTYSFEEIPLDQDLHLMDEKWAAEFEAALLQSINGHSETAYSVGYYAAVAARAVSADAIELSWYPNIFDRFHQIRITLPSQAFVRCVGSRQFDYDPIIFVRGDWLNNLYDRAHSVFALIDAINVRKELAAGRLTREKLIELRHRLDEIAAGNRGIAFMSFADSLLLKSNYYIGRHDSRKKYTYDPEKIVRLLPELQTAYSDILNLHIYVVMTQGYNEYYDDSLIHISKTRNHFSFNSLGLPFAQTHAIEHSARCAIRSGLHSPADAYLDETFYHSLRFKHDFDKNAQRKFRYLSPMGEGPAFYFPMSFSLLEENLESPQASTGSSH